MDDCFFHGFGALAALNCDFCMFQPAPLVNLGHCLDWETRHTKRAKGAPFSLLQHLFLDGIVSFNSAPHLNADENLAETAELDLTQT